MKKAKLDILEDIPDLEVELTSAPVSSEENQPEEETGERQWAINKILIVGLPIAIVVVAVVVIVSLYATRVIFHSPPEKMITKKTDEGNLIQKNKTQKVLNTKSEGLKAFEATPKTDILSLKDFLVDLKDVNGRHYILMFDIVLNLKNEKSLNISENITATRSIIFQTAQKQNVVAVRTIEERQKLKKELTQALENVLGEGTVKDVYFTNYFVM